MKCPKCQNENKENAKFCVKCGCRLEPAASGSPGAENQTCSKCGAVLTPGAKFCTKCGTPVEKKETVEQTMFLYSPEQKSAQDRTVILNTASIPGTQAQQEIVPPAQNQNKKKQEKKAPKEKEEKSSAGLILVAAILGVAAIAGIVVALIFFLPRDTDSKKDAKKTQEDVTETPPTDDETTDNPMQTQLENGQYAELIDTLLTIEDLEFYGDEENMREYMRQALAGHMSAAINEAQQLASAGDFDGAFGKIESELAYRDNLKGQGRVHPLTEDSSELESAREQLNSQYGEYVSKNVQARAEQKDLAGMESLLGQASGRLSEEQYNKISVDAYYLYVIKMVDQMQGEGQDPYAIMDFIDSYFERTNYHGYLMELWDNQNAQSGRVSTWNASVSHADSNGYLLYNSEGRNISKSELGNFTQYELYLARWEIYARHNRIFVDNALNTYFSKYGWYNGTVDFLAFDDSSLNEYEKGNIKTIIEYEKECGYR